MRRRKSINMKYAHYNAYCNIRNFLEVFSYRNFEGFFEKQRDPEELHDWHSQHCLDITAENFLKNDFWANIFTPTGFISLGLSLSSDDALHRGLLCFSLILIAQGLKHKQIALEDLRLSLCNTDLDNCLADFLVKRNFKGAKFGGFLHLEYVYEDVDGLKFFIPKAVDLLRAKRCTLNLIT